MREVTVTSTVRKASLTDAEWSRVFRARCASKRGEDLSPDDRTLIERAYKEDPKRYAAMNDAIFEATKPVGSY